MNLKREFKYVSRIEDVRQHNNELWMQILRIALVANPKDTKSVLADIRKNDMEISRLTGKIATDGNRLKKNR